MTAAKRAAAGRAGVIRLDDSLLFKLVRVVNLTARPFNEGIGRRHDLSLSDWRVMMVLGSHPGTTASDVCQRTGMDKMSVSRAIAALARRRRVTRKSDPTDGRRTLVRAYSSSARMAAALAVSPDAWSKASSSSLIGRVGGGSGTHLENTGRWVWPAIMTRPPAWIRAHSYIARSCFARRAKSRAGVVAV